MQKNGHGPPEPEVVLELKEEDFELNPAEAGEIRAIGRWLTESREFLKYRIFGEPTHS